MSFNPPEYLSPSSLSTFKQCPLRFKYTKIDGLREPDTEATVLGSFVHEILEFLFALPAEERTLNAARAIANSAWNERGWRDRVIGVIGADEAILRKFRWNAWWCVENYFGMESPAEIEPVGLEYEVTGEIEGVRIRGFVDRWSEGPNGIIVSDYKTGKTPAPRYRDDKFTQLFIYALMINHKLSRVPASVELLYLKDGTRLTSEVTESTLKSTTEMLITTNNEIMQRCESGEFEYKTSKLCNWCTFKSVCPAWRK